MILPIILICGIVFLDQISKWLIVVFVKGQETLTVIPGVLDFIYVENRGMAFSMLENHRWIFMTLSAVMIAGLLYFLYKNRKGSMLQKISVAFIIGGGIGNMIDRIVLGYVIDFIDFCAFPKIWHFPFNVADAFVCVGAGMLILYLIMDIVKEARKSENEPVVAEGTADKAQSTEENPEQKNEKNVSAVDEADIPEVNTNTQNGADAPDFKEGAADESTDRKGDVQDDGEARNNDESRQG